VRSLAAGVLAVLLTSSPLRADETVRVLAVPSLRQSFGALARAFERTRPGTRVQLQSPGEPADVVASDLVPPGAPVFASNPLAVVVPARRPLVTELAHLARPNTRIAMAATAVPAGRTTAALLQRMDESGRFGTQFKLRVLVNVVSEELDAREVLDRVVEGEADAGFVHATEAAAAGPRVRTLAIPPDLNVAARYAIGVPPAAGRAGPAHDFVAFVHGAEGLAILQQHGFGPP
jgi:molybdate transport system substrate-binding protein